MPRIGRRYLPPVYWAWNFQRFFRNPVRWTIRRAIAIPAISLGFIRIGLNRIRLSFLGFSITLSRFGIRINIPILSFLLGLISSVFGGLFGGLFRGSKGRGRSKGGAGSSGGSGQRGRGEKNSGGAESSRGGGSDGPRGDGPRPNSGSERDGSGNEQGGERGGGESGREATSSGERSQSGEPRNSNGQASRSTSTRDSTREQRIRDYIQDAKGRNEELRRQTTNRRMQLEDAERADRERTDQLRQAYEKERDDAERESRERQTDDRRDSEARERDNEDARHGQERRKREEQDRVEREGGNRVQQERRAEEHRQREARVDELRKDDEPSKERDLEERDRWTREREERERAEEKVRQHEADVEQKTQEERERREREREARDREVGDRQKRRKRRTDRRDERRSRPISYEDVSASPEGREFDIAGELPSGRVLLEASAGTGKTFNLTSLVVRYVVEDLVPIESFLIVTFTRSAAAELRKKTRDKLLEALSHLEHGKQPDPKDRWLIPVLAVESEDERQDRIELLRDAVSGLDGAMITTIHGFCQRTLAQIGVRNGGLALDKVGDGTDSQSSGVVRDTLLATLARDINYFGEDVAKSPEKIDKQIREVVDALTANSALPHPLHGSPAGVAEHWVSTVDAIREKQEKARRLSGETSFDDLILVLQRIITSRELGAEVRTQLAAQYKVLMIDEFQDTDAKQWEIFNELFVGNSGSKRSGDDQVALIMVGDPKQAIYRFRGADINAYLRATSSDDGLARFKLSTNHRSDRRLITATNALLKRRQFGHERIAYVQVTSPSDAPDGALTGAGAPLQIRWLPSHEELLDGGKSLKVDIARPHIADDLANHVVQLLSHGEIHEKNGRRPVQESDITILVRAKDDANPVVDALQRRGVPVIQSRLESVVNTEAAAQLSLLLTALDGYADARTVRALAFGWFVNLPYQDLLDEQQVESLQSRCAMWADELSQHGIFGFYQRFRLDNQVVEAIASRAAQRGVESLERLQTDLEHIVELLHARTERLPLDARGYLLELSMLSSQPGDPEVQERRTESDLNAVNVTTIHSSKGLEYPIVLLPYPKAVRNDKPYVYSIGPDRFVDSAPLVDWEANGLTVDDRKELAREEADGDDMRLAYVALTRAKYQTVMWWANTRNMGASPLAKIFFDETAASRTSVKVPKDSDVRAMFSKFRSDAPGSLEVIELPPRIDVAVKSKTNSAESPVVSAATLKRGELARSDFWRWSYSAIKKSMTSTVGDSQSGSHDEPWQSIDVGGSETSPLQSQPSGSAYGSWIHEFMESLDFTQLDLPAHLGATFDAMPVFDGADRAAHVTGLRMAIETPLDQIAQNFSLRTLARADRLDEASFLLEVGSGRSPVRLVELARIVAADTTHPFTEYFSRMADNANTRTFQGLLTGSLDGLFRVRRAQGPSYLVVDYKTNKLRSYDFETMRNEMELHDYPLQALIYSVGLHRMLKMRVQGYVPNLHLAGSAYLFLRGMIGPETPQTTMGRNGVFSWSYSPATIEAVDQWFAGETLS